MLDSLEGRRGEVRAKPPIPAIKGLWGRPTAVNNVLTLCAVPMILADGGAAYAELGTGRSRGTQVFQLAGNIMQGGIVELPFGVTLRELVEGYGGGTLTGRPVRAAQVGGPLGAYVPPAGFDVPMDYEALAEAGAMLGHGGIVVFDETVDMARMARFAMEFCSIESCGKCTPCRVGSTRGVETIDRIIAGRDVAANLVLLDDLCDTHDQGVAVRHGRPHPDARAERASSTSLRTSESRGRRAPGRQAERSSRMTAQSIWDPEVDFGTPAVRDADARCRSPSTAARSTYRPARRCCARPPRPASRSRSCAPPTRSRRSARVACAWSRSTAPAGVPASCTTPCADGMVVSTQTETVRELRRNVMELYLSDHPEDCDGCARGNCEIQAMAATVGSAEVRYGRPGVARGGRPPAADRPQQPLLRLRRVLAASSAPAACAPAPRPRAPSPSPSRAAASTRGSAPAAPTSSPPSASRAAPACRPARRPRSRSTRSSSSACPPARSRPRAPTAVSAARSAPRSRATVTTPRSCG